MCRHTEFPGQRRELPYGALADAPPFKRPSALPAAIVGITAGYLASTANAVSQTPRHGEAFAQGRQTTLAKLKLFAAGCIAPSGRSIKEPGGRGNSTRRSSQSALQGKGWSGISRQSAPKDRALENAGTTPRPGLAPHAPAGRFRLPVPKDTFGRHAQAVPWRRREHPTPRPDLARDGSHVVAGHFAVRWPLPTNAPMIGRDLCRSDTFV